jgi:hypothetical protein
VPFISCSKCLSDSSKSLVGVPEGQSETVHLLWSVNDSSLRLVPCELMEPMGELPIIYMRIQRGTKAMEIPVTRIPRSKPSKCLVSQVTDTYIEEVARSDDNDPFSMGSMTRIGQISIQHRINSELKIDTFHMRTMTAGAKPRCDARYLLTTRVPKCQLLNVSVVPELPL